MTDDEELYHVMLSIRAHGWTRNLPKFNKVTGEKVMIHLKSRFALFCQDITYVRLRCQGLWVWNNSENFLT